MEESKLAKNRRSRTSGWRDKKNKEASQYRGTMDNIQRQFTTEHG